MPDRYLEGEPASKRVLRRLGPLEEWFYLLNRNRPNHFSFVVETIGALSPRDCSRALQEVQARYPFLNVSIEPIPGAGPMLVSSDVGSIPLLTRPRVANGWMKELEREVSKLLILIILPAFESLPFHQNSLYFPAAYDFGSAGYCQIALRSGSRSLRVRIGVSLLPAHRRRRLVQVTCTR